MKVMKKYIFCIAMMGLGLHGYSQNAAKGKVVYDKVCVACNQQDKGFLELFLL
jgi:nitrite reductase (NO-forming)